MSVGVTTLEGGTTSRKPLLRGHSHAVATLGAIAGVILLLRLAEGDRPKQVALLVYGGSLVLLFAISALYHIGAWSPRRHALLRRLDHANIFLMLAGSYTPLGFTMLGGWERVVMLAAVWALALGGVVLVASRWRVPRQVRVALYCGLVALTVVASPTIIMRLGLHGLSLFVLSALLGLAGALIYATQRPVLWPRVFGYHELFHVVTIAATGIFFIFIVQQVIPFHGY